MSTSINIIPNNNLVSVQDSSNQLTITNNNSNVTVDVTQPITNIVQVLTGPQGQKGEIGPSGSASVVNTGSLVTTASFNSFTSSYTTDSSSFNSRIGSLTAATSSYVLNSQTSSMTVLSASFARTASFLPPGFYNISVAIANSAVPGGSDTQIQFNNSNTLDGSGYLTYDYTNENLKQGFENSAGANTFHFSSDEIINGQFSISGDLTGQFLVGNFLYISDRNYSNQFGEIVSRIVDVQYGLNTDITLEVNLNTSTTTGYILANLSLWPGDWTGDQETIPFYSHAQGQSSYVLGNYSHAEGEKTTAFGLSSHAEGYNTRAIGNYSHAEGNGTQAVGEYSHAEGDYTQAKGDYSHAEGQETTASGSYSHVEGYQTVAIGERSHAEGSFTLALGNYSHAEGHNTITRASYQHVQGQWNVASSVESAFIVGNGTDDGNRSNLIHAAGNEVQISGSVGITNLLTLTPQHPLPSQPPTGSFAVSSSVPPRPFFWNGTSWNALY